MKYAALVEAVEEAKRFIAEAEALLAIHCAENLTPVHHKPLADITTPVKRTRAVLERAVELTRRIWRLKHD